MHWKRLAPLCAIGLSLFFFSKAQAAITVVSVSTGESTTSIATATCTLKNVSVGDLIVVGGMYTANSTLATMTKVNDGTSNVYSHASANANQGSNTTDFFYSSVTVTGGTLNIYETWSVSDTSTKDIFCMDVQGQAAAPFDKANTIVDVSTSAPVGAICNPTSANELCASVVFTNSAVTANPKSGNEYTANVPSNIGICPSGDAGASAIPSTTGNHQPQWTTSGAATACSSTVAFKPLVSGGAVTTTIRGFAINQGKFRINGGKFRINQ